MQNDDFNQNGPDLHRSEELCPQSRRQVINGNPETICRRCGGPVKGRRRNGYCSDKCRLRNRRQDDRRKRLDLLNTINAAVEGLRVELGGNNGD